jgi:hypothetical protein
MSVNFSTVHPVDDSEPWEMSCDECGERVDIDHYYDMVAHDEMHFDEHRREFDLRLKGGPRHRDES